MLGPQLFVLYVNDLPSQFSPREVIPFADDTTTLSRGRTAENAVVKLQAFCTQIFVMPICHICVTFVLPLRPSLVSTFESISAADEFPFVYRWLLVADGFSPKARYFQGSTVLLIYRMSLFNRTKF